MMCSEMLIVKRNLISIIGDFNIVVTIFRFKDISSFRMISLTESLQQNNTIILKCD